MEKTTVEKEVSNITNTKNDEQQGKLSYDQLNILASQLSAQNKELRNRLVELDSTYTVQRLHYLFMVINSTSGLFSGEFETKCAKEIQEILNIPEEAETLKSQKC